MARRGPLFLARPGYRSRRLSDAARLLPLAGLFLLWLPLVWGPDAGTARVGIYLFAVWAGLIGIAALLAPRLPAPGESEGKGDRPSGPR